MTGAATEKNRNVSRKIVAVIFENNIRSVEVSVEKVRKNVGYFDARKSDYSMKKVNFPENILFYLNQSYLTTKKNNKIFYCDYFITGQTVKSSNPPWNVSSYTLKENEVKMVRPYYDPETGEFKGLYETIGYLVVRGSLEKVFFNYGFDKKKSKALYSYYRRRIPNSYSGTIFNRHRTIIESGEVEGDFSRIYFFLLAKTDKLEETNQYLNNVSISPIDISQKQLNICSNSPFLNGRIPFSEGSCRSPVSSRNLLF